MILYRVEVNFSQHINELFRVHGYEKKVRELTGGLATVDYTEGLIYVDCNDLLQAKEIDEAIKMHIDEVHELNNDIMNKIEAFAQLYQEMKHRKDIQTIVNDVRYDYPDVYNILTLNILTLDDYA